MKILKSALVLSMLGFTLAGCASKSGCDGDSCDRPSANSREIVIWWSPAMRDGLGDYRHQVDFTTVPVEN